MNFNTPTCVLLQASLVASLEQERDKARVELAAKARELTDKAREVAELQEQQRIDSSEADVLKTEVKAQQEQVNCLARDVEWLAGSLYRRLLRSRP